MNTEILIYKPNLLNNFNFTDVNFKLNDDGVTENKIWEVNNNWVIYNGYAECTNSNEGSLAQSSVVTVGKTYTITVNVVSLSSAGTLNVYLGGGSLYQINSTGIHKFDLTATGDDLELFPITGDDCTISWVKLVEKDAVYSLDLKEDVTIPITYSIADIRQPSKRNTSYSKTVVIPGTKNNNQLFNHIYEINSNSTFNPNKKAKCVILSDGIEVFNGVMQLKKINRVNNGLSNYDSIEYEINLLGNLFDLYSKMGNTTLNQLDFSEYNHDYTVPNQQSSWSSHIKKNGGNYTNWSNSGTVSIISCSANPVDGRVVLEFSTSHSFSVDDQVFINVVNGSPDYDGDHRVYEIISATKISLYYPYVTGTSITTGSCQKHTPTGEGYVYPMIWTGKHNNVPLTNHNGIDWEVKDFVPAIYLKEYLNKFQSTFDVVFVSSLFDSADFKRLILTSGSKDFKRSYSDLNAVAFQASTTSDTTTNITFNQQSLTPISGVDTWMYKTSNYDYNQALVFNDDSTVPNFDNATAFNTVTGKWTCPVTQTYKLTSNIKVDVDLNLPAGHTIDTDPVYNPINQQFAFTLSIIDETTSGVVAQLIKRDSDTSPVVQGSTFSVNLGLVSNQFIAIAGHVYKVVLNIYINWLPIKATIPISFTSSVTTDANALFFNEPVSVTYTDGEIVNIANAAPNMKCSDFLNTLIGMFNLYVEQDKEQENKFYIEPRDEYYASGVIRDWTDKLDVSQTVEQQPLGESASREYLYTFKQSKAELNALYVKDFTNEYGSKSYKVDNDFLTANSQNKVEVSVSSGVLKESLPVGSNRIITHITGSNDDRIEDNPRILYYSLSMSDPSHLWNHTSTRSYETINDMSLYPYAGHLDKVRGPRYDYNYFYPDAQVYTSNQYTSANLFNLYYKNQITEITSPDSKLITMSLRLKPRDIFDLRFNDIYIIDGHYLRLNKISDYIIGMNEPVRCEFTLVQSGVKYEPTFMKYSGSGKRYSQNMLDGYRLPNISLRESYSANILDKGYNNTINPNGTSNILITGNDNIVGPNSSNINLIGSNGVIISGGLENVTLINTDNVTITESNTSYINGVKMASTNSFVFVEDKSDLPVPVSGVITLESNTTYFFTTTVDLLGDSIQCGENTTILGGSSENCRIKSTGLYSYPMIQSSYSLPIRNITLEADYAIKLSGDTTTTALDWFGVNFTDCNVVGLIENYTNFIMSDCAFLNSGNLTLDGTIGTIAFNNSLFNTASGQTAILIPSTANITRRFRITYSSFVVLSGEVGVQVDTSAVIPTESYILDTVNFSGGGTYLSGVNHTSNKSLFVNCTGITNTAVNGQLYMQGNTTATTVAATNTFYKVAGTTTASADNSKFSHSNNRLTCDAVISRKYLIQCILSFTSGHNNVCEFGFYDSQLAGIRTPSRTKATANSSGRAENVTFACVLNMKSGDYLEIHCSNTSSIANITVNQMNFVIIEIK